MVLPFYLLCLWFLVVTITLIQDSTFKTISDTKIPILIVDNDKGNVSETILKGLEDSNPLKLLLRKLKRSKRPSF